MQTKIEFKVCGQGNNIEVYRECEEYIKKWQEILRIKDWDIKLEFLSANEMRNAMNDDIISGFLRKVIY